MKAASLYVNTMKTVLEVIGGSTDYLARRSIESPRLNAELLVAHALGRKKRLDLYMEFDRPLGEQELAPLRDLLRQRALGIPLQHLLGSVEFYGRTFRSDARALIPRPETEALMELLLTNRDKEKAFTFADIGTGSGIIALTLAGECPQARGCAVDLSPEALSLARENAAALGLEERVEFLESHLFSALEGRRFDLIVANLPYIPRGEIATLSREVQHDPHLALDGGEVGTELIERLIVEAPAFLEAGGQLALEIGHDQAAALTAFLETHHYRDVRVGADYQGVSRFLTAFYG